MLLKFICENYRSFQNEVVLDMMASSDACHAGHVIAPPELPLLRVLRYAAIYGANGAGKSNLVHAVSDAKNGLLNGAPRPYQPFRLSDASLSRPTRFEFYLAAGQFIYNYGYLYNEECIWEEWLFRTGSNGRETTLFTRSAGEWGNEAIIEFNSKAFQKEDREKLSVIASMTRPEQLFLYKAYENNVTTVEPFMDAVKGIGIVAPTARYAPLKRRLHIDKTFRENFGRFLATAGTGVSEIDAQEIPVAEVQQDKENDLNSSVPLRLVFKHQTPDGKGEDVLFFEGEESEGTLRLLDLYSMILAEDIDVHCVDELDRSLHPLLARHFIQTATEQLQGQARQIIFTTHESHLLDLDLLRRDEIWFVEKDMSQSTTLYSLTDFNARKDLRIEKGYLQGRFGAIPFLANPDIISVKG